jgi:hypothetical protein
VYHFAKNSVGADAALYYVMYSPIQVLFKVSFRNLWRNQQGNSKQNWKPTFLLLASLIVHVLYCYCYAYSYWYCYYLWKTSYLNTDPVYGKYVGYNVIISRGRRVCDCWRRSTISCINRILCVSFACLTPAVHWLPYNARCSTLLVSSSSLISWWKESSSCWMLLLPWQSWS